MKKTNNQTLEKCYVSKNSVDSSTVYQKGKEWGYQICRGGFRAFVLGVVCFFEKYSNVKNLQDIHMEI